MTRTTAIASITFIVVVTGCGQQAIQLAGADDESGERQSAIVNGTAYSGHPSVGMLRIGSNGLCTATLIGKKTVVTAAHCIGTSHTFVIGGQSYPAASAKTHPNWSSYTLANDIAIVLLAQAPAVQPSAIAVTAPAMGQEITLVGFGVSGEGYSDSGQKRMAKNKISQLSATRFSFSGSSGSIGSTCYGDSGGPAFATLGGVEVQIGVTSAGQKPCGTLAYDTRVDAFASWLEQQANGDVNKGGTAPNPNPNPNPNPSPTDTTAPAVVITAPAAGATVQGTIIVSATITDSVGVARAELLVDSTVVGTLTAAPWSFAATLAAGNHTLHVNAYDAAGNKGSGSVSVTVSGAAPNPGPNPDPATPAVGSYGAPCQGPADCTSKLCAEDPGFIGKYCTQTCNPQAIDCPTGAECLPTNNPNQFVCGPPLSTSPQPGVGPSGNGNSNGADSALLGSCSVGGDLRADTLAVVLLLLGGLVVARRRRR